MCESGERDKHVQYYINRMQYSGYNEEQRGRVYNAAKKKFSQIVKDDKDGKIPMYRSKMWQRERRQNEKGKKKNNWFDKDRYDTVMFVEATPSGGLAKKINDVIKKTGLSIKVVERSGTAIKTQLSKSNPFNKTPCGNGCTLCNTTGPGVCKTRDVVYNITCVGCGESYIGETSRSLGTRYDEHCRTKSSAIYEHSIEKHEGIQQDLDVRILAKCPSDPMLRQVTEAVFIAQRNPEINRKYEYGNTNLSRRKKQISATTSAPILITE